MLLDLDGVLNAPRAGWSGPPRTRRVVAAGEAWRLRWAPQAAQALADLGERIEIRWSTSWIDVGLGDITATLGLPTWSGAYPPDPDRAGLNGHAFTAAHTAAKTAAALAMVRAGHRLVWIDDEAIPTAGAHLTELDAAGCLLLTPDPRRGIRPEHVDAVHAWLTPA